MLCFFNERMFLSRCCYSFESVIYNLVDIFVCYCIDFYVEKMRFEVVKCMLRVYRLIIFVFYVVQVLGFSILFEGEGVEEKDVDGWEECIEWLKVYGVCFIIDSNGEMLFDVKVWNIFLVVCCLLLL